MSEQNPSQKKPSLIRPLQCEEWETLLADALDGNLPAKDSGSFEEHSRICAACEATLTQAKQGQEWLQFLHSEPDAPSELMAKILARTSGTVALDSAARPAMAGGPAIAAQLPVPLPFWKRFNQSPLRRMAEPRLMMTAAMAFFSVTLTLNIAGVRLTAIHLADLKPSAISTNIDREYHLASSRVVRYYYNLRFVYEMEARVRELRRTETESSPSQNEQKPAQPSQPQPSSKKSGGKSESPATAAPRALLWGKPVEAELEAPRAMLPEANNDKEAARKSAASSGENLYLNLVDQAERGLA